MLSEAPPKVLELRLDKCELPPKSFIVTFARDNRSAKRHQGGGGEFSSFADRLPVKYALLESVGDLYSQAKKRPKFTDQSANAPTSAEQSWQAAHQRALLDRALQQLDHSSPFVFSGCSAHNHYGDWIELISIDIKKGAAGAAIPSDAAEANFVTGGKRKRSPVSEETSSLTTSYYYTVDTHFYSRISNDGGDLITEVCRDHILQDLQETLQGFDQGDQTAVHTLCAHIDLPTYTWHQPLLPEKCQWSRRGILKASMDGMQPDTLIGDFHDDFKDIERDDREYDENDSVDYPDISASDSEPDPILRAIKEGNSAFRQIPAEEDCMRTFFRRKPGDDDEDSDYSSSGDSQTSWDKFDDEDCCYDYTSND